MSWMPYLELVVAGLVGPDAAASWMTEQTFVVAAIGMERERTYPQARK